MFLRVAGWTLQELDGEKLASRWETPRNSINRAWSSAGLPGGGGEDLEATGRETRRRLGRNAVEAGGNRECMNLKFGFLGCVLVEHLGASGTGRP
jgi:hypothetical protein